MNRAMVVDQLVSAGLNASAVEHKAELFERAAAFLEGQTRTGRTKQSWYFVPGRIEVLGKHTDYAGGRSLLCAIECGFCVVATPRNDQRIRIADAVRGQKCQFALSPHLDAGRRDWSVYPKTVARRIARNFPDRLRGVDMVIASDLTSAAGLSSSSALIVATFLVLHDRNELQVHPAYQHNIRATEDLATYLGCVENGQTFGSLAGDAGVGTFGGSEDHTAILLCRPGWLSQFRFCPVQRERTVELPKDCTFVVAVSGISADKTGGARERYNRTSETAKTILEIWQAASGLSESTLLQAATQTPDAADRIRQLLRESHSPFPAQTLVHRFDQFLEESIRNVPEAADALARNDLGEFGRIVDRSQASAERGLGNQIQETEALAGSARELGAIAASAFGAGFGGSVWAMVKADQAPGFEQNWKDQYWRQFPERQRGSDFFVCATGPAAMRL